MLENVKLNGNSLVPIPRPLQAAQCWGRKKERKHQHENQEIGSDV